MTSSIVDRVAAGLGRPLVEVPVGFKWFVARPSGPEDVYKIYAESFLGRRHLARILARGDEHRSERTRERRRATTPLARALLGTACPRAEAT